jgi:hypothetical protein
MPLLEKIVNNHFKAQTTRRILEIVNGEDFQISLVEHIGSLNAYECKNR